ncbi:MAG: D-tyrosyl-tRNA(Tyr) deacylase [Planctomycetales bacterium]|nr:D-tyrosyl-tRNA(Tyr) deacylase [Planctomycetales bacterium]
MRALLQRVTSAHVEIDGVVAGAIQNGLLVLLGVGQGDTEQQGRRLLDKILQLRIFEDAAGKMNLSLLDVGGQLLVVSQFTLWANCRKGRRPSFVEAGPPPLAKPLYEWFLRESAAAGVTTASGEFGADMQVHLVNDGPVTIWLDTDHL